MKRVFFLCVICICSVGVVMAQTTLSGDHVITGNLGVGNTGASGNLEVTGETGNTAAPGIKVIGDGGVLFNGTLGIGKLPASGLGTRFMWYSGKGALRAGNFGSTESNDANIGVGSVAFSRSQAKGEYSTAIGGGVANGVSSTAISGGTANGMNSTAISGGTADGYCSLGMSEGIAVRSFSTGLSGGVADSEFSVAMSYGVTTEWSLGATAMSSGISAGYYSTSMSGGSAYGVYSTAMSSGFAVGTLATAMSGGNAQGFYSMACGDVTAHSYRSVAIGRNEARSGLEDYEQWIETDPLFVIGNGTGNPSDICTVQRRNAFVVRKNGNVEMSAKVTMPRQGDILMGEFGNPE